MRSFILLAAFAAACSASASAATPYSLKIIGNIDFAAGALNDQGYVAYDQEVGGNWIASVYTGSSYQQLGTLGGSWSSVGGINNLGQVVGYSLVSSGKASHAFLYSNGAMQDLGTLGGNVSKATGINDQGTVVGYSGINTTGTTHAFVYTQSGGIKDLGTLGGQNSRATSVNANGDILGFADTASGDRHSFFYSNGVMTDLDTKLGLGQSDDPSGYILKTSVHNATFGNNGAIVGELFRTLTDPSTGLILDSYSRGFVYNNGVLSDVNDIAAIDMNAQGTILTEGYFLSSTVIQNGVQANINTLTGRPDIDLQYGIGLNASGQILATGVDSNNQQITVLLSPVPEPASWVMLLAGLGMLGWVKRRRVQA